MNIPRNVSLFSILEFMALGGAASLLLSMFLEDSLQPAGSFGPPVAGMLEEFGKFAIVLFCARAFAQKRFPYLLNGLLIGACVGAGFASAESAGYALVFGASDGSNITHVIYLRGVLAPFGHVAWTAITAGALWRALETQKLSTDLLFNDRRFQRVFLLPVILHGLWDADFDPPFQAKYIVLGVIAWIAVFSLIQSGIRQIRELQGAAVQTAHAPAAVAA